MRGVYVSRITHRQENFNETKTWYHHGCHSPYFGRRRHRLALLFGSTRPPGMIFLAEMRGETTSSTAPRPVSRPTRKAGGLFASGAIEAEEVTVAAEMGGRIVALLADEGDDVAAGDVLVRLDQTILLAQREQAEAAVAQAQAARGGSSGATSPGQSWRP